MKNTIVLNNKTNYEFKYLSLLQEIFDKLMNKLEVKSKTEISLNIVENNEIQKLSKIYRNKDKVTDILSFKNDWEILEPIIGYKMLGDLYISFKKVEEQAKEYKHSELREWSYLFGHGIMHIMGNDHLTKKDEDYMHSYIELVLKEMNIRRKNGKN
ncbi:MAG: rRNA maturation RNase YbeY [Mollicutes bacterium PWAP]|nr:rRNA maturation RNase YbeY [Mollicutes bacterium PWAP]